MVAGLEEAMDGELRQKLGTGGTTEEDEALLEHPSELEVDMDMVRNLLESVQAQEGMAGPMSTMMGGLGGALPQQKRNAGVARNGATTTTRLLSEKGEGTPQ